MVYLLRNCSEKIWRYGDTMERKNMQQLEKDLKNISAGKILDVATGSGEFIHTLTQSLKDFDEITGIDTNERALKAAEKHFTEDNISFKDMDAYKFSFEPESFETVSLSNSLHHFAEIDKILMSMKRVLKKDGYFIINEMHCDEDQTEEQKTHVQLHHWWGEIDSRMGVVHNKTYTSEQIERMVTALDLKDVHIYEFAYPIENPRDEKMINRYLGYFDPYVDRLKDHKDYKKLKETGEKLKLRLKEIGFAPATSLFLIGRK